VVSAARRKRSMIWAQNALGRWRCPNGPTQMNVRRLNQSDFDRKPSPMARRILTALFRGDANVAQIWARFASLRTNHAVRGLSAPFVACPPWQWRQDHSHSHKALRKFARAHLKTLPRRQW
jgi:hypothetical protein